MSVVSPRSMISAPDGMGDEAPTSLLRRRAPELRLERDAAGLDVEQARGM